MDIPTTKARYFALGLVLCDVLALYVYRLHIPPNTKGPEMWLNVQLAINGGMYMCLFFGAFAGFTFAYKVLPALKVFLLSILSGAGATFFIVSGIVPSLTLEAIALASLFVGFVISWGSASLFGNSPNTALKMDRADRAAP